MNYTPPAVSAPLFCYILFGNRYRPVSQSFIFSQNDPFMPDFDISINIYVLLLVLAAAMWLGFLGRSRQIARKKRQIAELEQEMMQAHAELLETQRDYCELESRVNGGDSPVISLKDSNKNRVPPEKPLPEDGKGARRSRSAGTGGSAG